jgi:hypothetical protein
VTRERREEQQTRGEENIPQLYYRDDENLLQLYAILSTVTVYE